MSALKHWCDYEGLKFYRLCPPNFVFWQHASLNCAHPFVLKLLLSDVLVNQLGASSLVEKAPLVHHFQRCYVPSNHELQDRTCWSLLDRMCFSPQLIWMKRSNYMLEIIQRCFQNGFHVLHSALDDTSGNGQVIWWKWAKLTLWWTESCFMVHQYILVLRKIKK